MFAAGVLTTYIAITTFQQRSSGARSVAALAGLTSIGWMAIVNFMIDSDFKWLLPAFNIPWIVALIYNYDSHEQT